ncbi:alpha/beta fold hydrolase [Aldersonia kunmingensis]|uniref:alpha/beta fold hydrolase n=1 Tax=Aldersonia kunmingensis TaxID=408066 RepID=UPI00082CD0AE|nr:alpha/beta hydrolase [Aldersonia kunmingensis]
MVSESKDFPVPETRTFRGQGDIELVGDIWGPEDGPLVVMLHGGGQTRGSWKSAGTLLARAGVRVVVMDARGHGDSQWAPDGDYSGDSMAADLIAILAQLGRPATLVGASMGGLTSLRATGLVGSDLINGLVLVDVVPRAESEGVERIMTFLGGHRDGFATLDEAADAVAEYLPHRERPKSTKGLERNLRKRADGRWYWHWDPAMLGPSGLVEGEVSATDLGVEVLEEAARKLTIPTMLLRGRMSDVVSEEGVRHFLSIVPHCEFVELAGAAHTAAGDDNDAFTDAVCEFVKGVTATS